MEWKKRANIKIKVNIFGSCCTRELFNYQDKYEVGCYVMQQSIFTMFSKPLNISYEDAKGTDNSDFKKRMMYYEFNKLGLSKIIEEQSEYLVVDFADCRYDIYEFDNPKGVRVIYTHESRATFDNIKDSRKFKNIKKHYCNVEESFTDEMIVDILTEFCKKILKVYDTDHIILNRIQMSDTYYENNEEKKLENNFHYSKKSFISKVENMFLELMPNCKILETEENPILNINHKFGGPHPMHYEDIYYEYKMNLLDSIISNTNNLEIIKQEYYKKVQENMNEIKSKSHNEENSCKSSTRVD